MANIFISYSRKDHDFVQNLLSDLSSHGHSVWVDFVEIKVGESILSKIEKGLAGADYLIIALSQNFLKSTWANMEYTSIFFSELSKNLVNILPVLIEDCDIPIILQNKKYADFRSNYNTGFSELIEGISTPRNNKNSKLTSVWYIDDNAKARADFARRHREQFNITLFDNVFEFIQKIQATPLGSDIFPDIALIDLYSPVSEFEVNRSLLEETNNKLCKFFQLEKDLKKYVDNAWKPYGVNIINAVMEQYSSEMLPIVLYTQRGLVLLDDELIRELELRGVRWLLKKQFSAETERLIINKIIMSRKSDSCLRKRKILFVDDNPIFQDLFIHRHGNVYDVECITDHGDVIPKLQQMKVEGKFPDLLLSDLYYPRGRSKKALDLIDIADRKLQEFHDFESNLKKLVRQTYEPIGARVIKEIREIYTQKQLPILIYTQTGLLLLDDEMIQKLEALDAGWLLKDRYSTQTEQIKILGHIKRSKK